MPIVEDNAEYQVVVNETATGSTRQVIPKPGSQTQNQIDVFDQLWSLRANLTTAYNTVDTIANATGTLTTAQLTTQLRQVASAVRFALRTEGRLVRTIVGDYSGTD